MSIEHVTSKDGTKLAVLRDGDGPGVVLVQGAVGTVEEYSGLAQSLAERFTVWRPERRGRGSSPCEFRASHSVAREVEDLEAVLKHSGARGVFGLSSGAVISLTATARGVAGIERLAVFEPPLYSRHGWPREHSQQYWNAIERDDLAAAMTAAGKAVGLMPALEWLPDFFVNFVTRRLLKSEPAMAQMPLTIRFDLRVVEEMHARWRDEWRGISVPTLLVGGDRSPKYLLEDLAALSALLPSAKKLVLPGLDHGSAWNPHPQRNRRGDPPAVAAVLTEFFEGLGR